MAQSELTVTPVGPTPPTNMSFVGQRPPTAPGLPFVDDGAAGTVTAFAAPTSGQAHEAAGTEVIVVAGTDPDPNHRTTTVSVLGAYTATPNKDHASAKAPAVAPTITGLVPPTTLAAGGGTMALTVNGTGFRPDSVIYVNSIAYPTTYYDATKLNAQNVQKRTTAGTLPVTVVTGGVATSATNWTFT